MNKLIDKINNSNWTDWSLKNIELDFDKIVISLSEELEGFVKFTCKDYIGLSIVGHWDETVIESIIVEYGGSLVNESIEKVKRLYGNNPIKGGGIKDIKDDWYQMNIKLIDGNIYKFAFREIEDETNC